MKTRIFTIVTAAFVCFFAACGSGTGSGSSADSVKTDTSMAPAAMDTTMKADSGMHKADTSSLPK